MSPTLFNAYSGLERRNEEGTNRRSDDRKRESMVNYKCRQYSTTGKDGTRLKRNNKKILKISRKRD